MPMTYPKTGAINALADARIENWEDVYGNTAEHVIVSNSDNELVGPIIATADTAANLASYTPKAGELVYETDTGKMKKGDGSTTVPGLKSFVISELFENLDTNGYSIVSGADENIALAPGSGGGVELGVDALARLSGMIAHATGKVALDGDLQCERFILYGTTTDNSATELTSPERFAVVNGKAYACTITILGCQSVAANAAIYKRMCIIKGWGGTTSLSGAVQTIGTDIETDADWDVTISADDTNDSLKVEVTGDTAQTITWIALIESLTVPAGDDD